MKTLAIVWLVAALALDVGDILTTAFILANGGVELNPAAASLFQVYGLYWGLSFFLIIKVGIVLLVLNQIRYAGSAEAERTHGRPIMLFAKAMLVILVYGLLVIKLCALAFNLTALI